ncbi:MAG: DNA repair protein RecN [Desulfobacterales bacterium]|nr:DNA repair protein RecN [Desulfobacterales bacterium]
MLCELKIENLALIESLHLTFDQNGDGGLVVMTGETGAGKSIMMQAIGLLTGARASADWIRSGAESCSVEALFTIDQDHKEIRSLLEEGGFGDEPVIIIKRVVTQKGRSRLYINGSMATVRVASDICFHLLTIASQHEHQYLLQPSLHLDFLDTLGEHWPVREVFRGIFEAWRLAQKQLAELRRQERERAQRFDFLLYQVQEIRDVAPLIGEDEELFVERRRLKSAESLIRLSRENYGILSSSVTDSLAQVRKNMEQLAALDPAAEQLAEDLGSYSFMAEDYCARLRDYFEHLENDPLRLEAVNERLDQLQAMKRKYGETLEDVLSYLEKADEELQIIENLDQEIEDQSRRTLSLEIEVLAAAKKLSHARQNTAREMEIALAGELNSLAFSRPEIEVQFQVHGGKIDEVRSTGFDRVEFFFAPNPGEPSRPLSKVASGGELSRLMLAMKCLLARKDIVETVIFDEVDAGVGGEAAEAVARKIRQLAGHHQVLCITHLPQIAARGTKHFKVEKSVQNGRTLSTVVLLSQKERVRELARMLAGESASEQTKAWALELLEKGTIAA